MPTFEVTTELVVYVAVKVRVEAGSKDDAIVAALELVGSDPSDKGWMASVAVKPPKGVNATSGRVQHIKSATGSETAKRVTDAGQS